MESQSADPEIVQRVFEELEALRGVEEADGTEAAGLPIDRTGALVGRYRVANLLGRGGMGEVYAAWDGDLGRQVALKFLLRQSIGDATALKQFIREAKAASALNHPNILTIHEVIDSSAGLAIAMELVEGQALNGFRSSELPWRDVTLIGKQVAAALAAAHEQGIVHRDIKPENLMLRPDGIVKVLDFGLAQSFGGKRIPAFQSSITAAPGGTLRYMSPEQLRDEPLTGASDVYSLGLVLYELTAGCHPFESSYAWETAYAIHSRDPLPPSATNQDTPGWLGDLIVAMLNRDPALRPSAHEVASALANDRRETRESNAKQRLLTSPPATATVPPAARRTYRKWLLRAVAASMALAAAWSVRDRLPPWRMEPVSFTDYPGDEDMPSFSPDGASVAFAWNGPAQDNFDIYVRQIGSTSVRRVTASPLQDYSPAWSPDGASIAFLRKRPNSTSAMLIIVPAGGGPEREVAGISLDLPESNPLLSWTPNGKWLVAPGRDSEREPTGLFLISPTDGTQKRLTRPPADQIDFAPAVAPDGRTLAFVRSYTGGTPSIYLLSLTAAFLSGGEPQPVPAFYNVALATPQWTSDGKELLFVANPGTGGVAIWRTGAPERGKPLEPPHREPYVGRSSRIRLGPPNFSAHRLMYSTEVEVRSAWLIPIGVSGTARRIAPANRNISDVRVSPDGSKVVYQSMQTGSTEIWTSNLDGSHPVQLTNFGQLGTGSGAWSPDGQRIAFDSGTEGRPHIYVVPASGGAPQRLTDGLSDNYLPAWSNDGHWIYYCSTRSGAVEVWRQPAAGGAAEQITQHGGWAPALSPDGASLYYQRRAPGGWSLRERLLATGMEREVLPAITERAFTIGRNGIYYISLPGLDGQSTVQFRGFGSEVSRPITTISKPMPRPLSVAPDGSFLLYSQIDHWGQDLMLVENFH